LTAVLKQPPACAIESITRRVFTIERDQRLHGFHGWVTAPIGEIRGSVRVDFRSAGSTKEQEGRSMFKRILLGIVALIALLAVVIATRPSHFTIERSVEIDAPAEVAFRYVNDPRELNKWNPWVKLDPNITTSLSGPPSGVGAVYEWEGNSQVGKGRQTIVESVPGKKVGIKLEFFEPMEGTNDVVFAFAEGTGRTRVTWAMSGEQNFVMKGMSMFMDMDQMVGDEFNKGLASLKTLAETDARQPAPPS
jgi:hypothetical protein